MKIRILTGCLALLFGAGCASLGSRYASTFNDAVADGDSRVLISARPFEELHKDVLLDAERIGYGKAVHYNFDEGFYVVVKNPKFFTTLLSANAQSRCLMIKFTRRGDKETRIDLVNAGTDLMARKEVDADINALGKKINSQESDALAGTSDNIEPLNSNSVLGAAN